MTSIRTSVLGFPCIGPRRELKAVLEDYWAGRASRDDLDRISASLRRIGWKTMREAGIDSVPSNDFTYYDPVLDTSVMMGAVPRRFTVGAPTSPLDLLFAMARGRQDASGDAPAMEMTKWFDTNCHYIVPEFAKETTFTRTTNKPIEAYDEAKAEGLETRPVLLGPISFLLLGKARDGSDPLDLLDRILPLYATLLSELQASGAQWVQIDEPCLTLDLLGAARIAVRRAYETLAIAAPRLKIMLTPYFQCLREPMLSLALSLPVAGLHFDLTSDSPDLGAIVASCPKTMTLSLGVISGRNIWRTDLEAVHRTLAPALDYLGAERTILATSCSLKHVPYDLSQETKLDPTLRSWMAFAVQKVEELSCLARGVEADEAERARLFAQNRAALESRRNSTRAHVSSVRQRLAKLRPEDSQRPSSYVRRSQQQDAVVTLPLFPTTTIGSFPQTSEVRKTRAAFRRGEIEPTAYNAFLQKEIGDCIKRQESLGLDVLVHGEFERTDMVEYFGELLEGFAVTEHGWVQSYGTRCVKPPIIYGDVWRASPMTVRWSTYAQSQTSRPVKGMLTGPVTILQWSFVRDDQPRSETCTQIALAIRDEVLDLERAGLRIIQIDEPALREGLPLRRAEWDTYLDWAVKSFRLASSGVRDETQIHTHMCYAEFNDILPSIAAMDADVISIETSRSHMELLDGFRDFAYPNGIGPGVYDIHSPRVPSVEEMVSLLTEAAKRIPKERLWVNPDCGLKTRGWPETEKALANMVSAARTMRKTLVSSSHSPEVVSV